MDRYIRYCNLYLVYNHVQVVCTSARDN
eukprot:SAG31_NODE_35423_length_323_cov_0.883929_1_plen_27_part_01